MNGESSAAGLGKATARVFVYPQAPWEPGTVASAALFREIGSGEATAETANALEQVLAALPIPVLYEYSAHPGSDFEMDEVAEGAADHGQLDREPELPESPSEQEQERQELLAAECAKAAERGHRTGREEGLAEGRAQGREEACGQLQASVEAEKNRFLQQTAALFQSFRDARDGCVHRLEQEAARLALAIAARVLRREAQADPLLLTGAVRIALGQLADSTAVRLRVPAADLAFWQEAMAHLPNLAIRPEVAADLALKLGDCRLETELGSANLSLQSQLDALEREFFSPEVGEAHAPSSGDFDLAGGSHGR
jgi:flagellar assembly protein FliH